MTAKEQIAFFGGSFDPPHLGHLAVASAALRAGACGHVAWVPAFAPPHKNSNEAGFADRLAMVEATISGCADMSANRIEAELALDPSYTFKVLEAWEKRYGAPPALLIGADSLHELHSWYHAEELAVRWRIITYPRDGCRVDASELARHWSEKTVKKLLSGMLDGDFFEISSSELKNRMENFTAAGDIMYLKDCLASAVCDYIVEHGLYVRGGRSAKK